MSTEKNVKLVQEKQLCIKRNVLVDVQKTTTLKTKSVTNVIKNVRLVSMQTPVHLAKSNNIYIKENVKRNVQNHTMKMTNLDNVNHVSKSVNLVKASTNVKDVLKDHSRESSKEKSFVLTNVKKKSTEKTENVNHVKKTVKHVSKLPNVILAHMDKDSIKEDVTKNVLVVLIQMEKYVNLVKRIVTFVKERTHVPNVKEKKSYGKENVKTNVQKEHMLKEVYVKDVTRNVVLV